MIAWPVGMSSVAMWRVSTPYSSRRWTAHLPSGPTAPDVHDTARSAGGGNGHVGALAAEAGGQPCGGQRFARRGDVGHGIDVVGVDRAEGSRWSWFGPPPPTVRRAGSGGKRSGGVLDRLFDGGRVFRRIDAVEQHEHEGVQHDGAERPATTRSRASSGTMARSTPMTMRMNENSPIWASEAAITAPV